MPTDPNTANFMKLVRLLLLLSLSATWLGAPTWAQNTNLGTTTGPETGLPIPRFVALKVDEARMRSKPSTDHSILFIYLREGLPMKVLEERGDWRRVVDHEGFEGWMKNTILTNDRTFRIIAPVSDMHLRADMESPVRAELQEGVIGNISLCRGGRVVPHICATDGRLGTCRRFVGRFPWGEFLGLLIEPKREFFQGAFYILQRIGKGQAKVLGSLRPE